MGYQIILVNNIKSEKKKHKEKREETLFWIKR